AESQQEDARFLWAEETRQLAPQFHSNRGALDDDAIAVETDRAVDRIEDEAGEQFAHRRLAAAVEQLRGLERCLHKALLSAPVHPTHGHIAAFKLLFMKSSSVLTIS